MMPRIRITELLHEVARETGFMAAFTLSTPQSGAIERRQARTGSFSELSVRDAVTIADRVVAGSGWLPSPVRLILPEVDTEIEAGPVTFFSP